MNSYDVAIVGAGIVGLAHAWRAAARGLRVVVFERDKRAIGASIRNFGMVWPIGQPAGSLHATAMRSRELWLELAREAGIWHRECGSLHLAHREDELSVLEEFAAASAADFQVQLLTPAQTLKRTTAANPDGLRGAMWSPSEMCVDPPNAIAAIARWLQERHQVQFEFSTAVTDVEAGQLQTGGGRAYSARRIVICSGTDFATLMPSVFAGSELRVCKLHMMRTIAQTQLWQIGPHLASGLTLRHYHSFAHCPSLEVLKKRVADETPELDRFGIHVMASQNEHGQIVLGDSHQYDEEIPAFDRVEIDDLILRELRRQFSFPTWQLESRWHGLYAKHPTLPIFDAQPMSGVHVRVGPGGAGMTMSFGLAEEFWTKYSV